MRLISTKQSRLFLGLLISPGVISATLVGAVTLWHDDATLIFHALMVYASFTYLFTLCLGLPGYWVLRHFNCMSVGTFSLTGLIAGLFAAIVFKCFFGVDNDGLLFGTFGFSGLATMCLVYLIGNFKLDNQT